MNKELAELYSDYLLSSFGAATATGLSDMLEGEVSVMEGVNGGLSVVGNRERIMFAQMTLPVASPASRWCSDENTGRLKRRGEVSKNELMRRMLKVCQQNRLEYRYVLADS